MLILCSSAFIPMTNTLQRFLIGLAVLVLAAVNVSSLRAQDAPADSLRAWQTQATGQLSASQAGFQNWQEGGVNTLALSAGINGKASRTTDRWEQVYESRFAFGLVKQDTLDLRKAEDLIVLRSTVKYRGDGFFFNFRPTLSASLRTQFAEGFNYDKDPLDQGRPLPAKVSAFFSPATVTQSLGLTYKPVEWFTQRIGIAAKETVVMVERFRPLYGVEPDNPVRFEAGMESFTEVDKELFENVHYQSKLGLFASFNQPDKPDALWENLITMQVNRWLNVSFEFVTVYDLDISNAAQLKEVLSLGVSFNLL